MAVLTGAASMLEDFEANTAAIARLEARLIACEAAGNQ